MKECFVRKEQKSEDVETTLRFHFFGGWCPNVTSLIEIDEPEFEKTRNYEDVKTNENVSLYFKVDHNSKYISSISCGIPEELFAHANIQWCSSGLFILAISFTEDWERIHDISESLNLQQIRTLTQNILYKEIKKYHHTHTHHREEEDNLLTLLYLGDGINDDIFSLEVNMSSGDKLSKRKSVKKLIFDHIYKQYSIKKPDEYVKKTIELLGDSPTPKQLEQAILLLYQGIGEAAFGIAFLKKYGSKFYKLPEMNIEYIGLESAMRNLDALRGKFFFDYIKATKNNEELIKNITDAITSTITRAVSGYSTVL